MRQCSYCGADIDYINNGGVCECGVQWCNPYVNLENYMSVNCKRRRNNEVDYRLNNIDDILESKRVK